MIHVLTPLHKNKPDYVTCNNVFISDELYHLQVKALHSEERASILSQINPNDETMRRTKVSWIYNDEEKYAPLFHKLANVISDLNAQVYNFDLIGFGEALQLANYDSSDEGMYDWHIDMGPGISRKLSVVVQLTDPDDYEGGELQIMTGRDIHTIKKERGLITIFPSYTLHKVTPVTKGSRQSLVAWISGPPFK